MKLLSSHRVPLPLVVCFAGILGCSSFSKPYPDKSLHTIDLSLSSQPKTASLTAANLTSTAAVLRVDSVRISEPFDGNSFVYRTGPSKFTNDYYNGFIAAPTRILTADLTEWLAESGMFASVVSGKSAAEYQYSLESNFTSLYGDYRPGQSPNAVIEATFFLIDQTEGQYKVVF